MGRVFITQETGRHNFVLAEQFGTPIFLSIEGRDELVNVANSPHNDGLLNNLSALLSDFDEDEDYVIPVGSPYVNYAVFTLLGLRQVRRVQILRWDNRNNMYVLLPLTIRQETVNAVRQD